MGLFVRGDVVLAPVMIDGKHSPKVRPCVVVSAAGDGSLTVCPVSTRPSGDLHPVPVTLDDFSCGGLDLFSVSYLLVSMKCRIMPRDVIGKKGRLSDEYISANIP